MTIEAESADYQAVVGRLDPQAVVERTWPLLGGISAQMTAVAYRDGDGNTQTVIVRCPPQWSHQPDKQVARHEFELLEAVHAAGTRSPRPYYYDESGDLLDAPFLVVEYFEGAPVFSTADTIGYATQLAAEMARYHRLDISRPPLSDLPKQAPRLQRLIFDATVEAENLDYNHIRQTLQSVWPLPALNEPALLHGDIWAGNLVWNNGRLAGIIDWEDAHLGDPMWDVSVARLDLLWAFDWPMVAAFTNAYREFSTTDMSQMAYWDLAAAIRPGNSLSVWATAWPVVGRTDVDSGTMRRDQREFAEQALAALTAM